MSHFHIKIAKKIKLKFFEIFQKYTIQHTESHSFTYILLINYS